ncbi:alpha/beta fold hydrolase [Pseudotabrizicola sp. L79]|uniref:alpha/beta fold hydrolase n=1 Tax=Pseudotabrizicola sp. L79 TaxID=3118402 RepID=UPI002F937A16
MRFRTLVASLATAAVALAATTAWRVSAREKAALAAHPPTGQFVLVDGAKVHVQVQGTGPDLVLIHGANGSLREFTLGLADRLADRYRVIMVDRPGLGHSDPLPRGQTSVAAQANRLRATVAQLGVTTPLVLGQSYGGAVALAWALQERPAALVLVSGVAMPWPGKLDPWYRATDTALGRHLLIPLAAAFVPESYVRRSIEGVFAPQSPPAGYADHIGVDFTLRRSSLGNNVDQLNNLRPEMVQMQPHYPTLDLPIEVIHGDADTIVPLQIHARPLSELVPQANLTVLAGAGHMPHHTHPDAVIAAIDRAANRSGLR